ncbi:type I polyketide synthase, partial [Dactylosporangium sucinum]|uniref:type I polyketide synthase n=1 Tax=Dactylosporangium sucinum TaxID=1424081 RepID=UPI001E2BA4F8
MDVSPDGVLTSMIALTAPDAVVVPTLRPGNGLLSAAGGLHAAGVEVDWTAVLGAASVPVQLPTYAFEHERYWLDAPPPVTSGDGGGPFWAAVDRADADGLADVLGLGDTDRPALAGLLPALARWRGRQLGAGWWYDVAWQPRPEPATRPPLSGRWVLVTSPGVPADLTTAIDTALTQAGAGTMTVDAGSLESVDWSAVGGVVSLLGCAEGPSGALHETVRLLRRCSGEGVTGAVWCLTQGGAPVAGGVAVEPAAWPLWGMGRVAALEYPRLWGGLVDLPATVDATTADRLVAVLAGGHGEDQVAVRGDGTWVRRLVRGTVPDADRWTPRGTVLVTGASGALGAHVARWAAASGADRIVLASRRGEAAPNAVGLAADLAAAGAEAVFVRCDISDPGQVADLVAVAGDGLTAVVHAAGTVALTPLADADPQDWTDLLAAKAGGASALDRALGDRPLDAFVLFSSIAGVWGSGGQAAYAAANAFLDGLATARRERGLAGTAVAWGPWRGGGMAEGPAAEHLARRGLATLDPDLAVTAMAYVAARDRATAVIVDVDWATFAPAFTLTRPAPLLDTVAEAAAAIRAAAEEPAPTGSGGLADRLAGLSAAERQARLLDLVRERAAAVLGHASAAAIPAGQAFNEIGFDSLTAVELRNGLAQASGLSLPATLVFDHPNPEALAEYLGGRLGGPTRAVVVHAAAASDEPVAIVGIACRFPGGVASPDDFWRLIAAGEDGITGFPTDRGWDLDGLFAAAPDREYLPEGGFLPGLAGFDAAFFGISPREALAMDPQQRLLLEASWEAFEQAGIDPQALRGAPVGVFAGAGTSEYSALLAANRSRVEGYGLTGNVASVLSGRVAYTLGLTGPAVTVDTACSSSLVALHLAAQSLRSGECTLALAGGVTAMATPGTFAEFALQDGLAANGRCKSYAGAADGTGWGEGVGMLVVERLSDARANGHRVLAVLRGSAVNQDGASNGLTAPNGPSQERVILQALANAGLSPSDVDVVEGHGTGTRLGDPIEAQALLATYGQDRDEPLWLGSVKSNIGHTQAAAGVAGVIKMVLSMRHATMPATLHVDEPSPHVDWSAGRVALLTESRPWPNGRPRRAGVSSFGISGTNAHVIIEEGDPSPASEVHEGPTAWIVSAKSERALRAQAARLAEWAERTGPDPHDTAVALATQRSRFAHRAVVTGA